MDQNIYRISIILQWKRKYPYEDVHKGEDPEWLDVQAWLIDYHPTYSMLQDIAAAVQHDMEHYRVNESYNTEQWRVIRREEVIRITEEDWDFDQYLPEDE